MQTTPTILDMITLGIAAWGAVLSTILAFKTIRKDKRRVKVICRLIERKISSDGSTHSLVFGLEAVNIGHRDVRLESVGLKTNRKRYYRFDAHGLGLPVTLRDGESIVIRMGLSGAGEFLKNSSPNERFVFAYFRDTERVEYRTSRFPIEMIESGMVKKSWWGMR